MKGLLNLPQDVELPLARVERGSREDDSRSGLASPWQLAVRGLRRHVTARISMIVLRVLAFVAIFCEFLAPYDDTVANDEYVLAPPQRIHFRDRGQFSFHPFVYGLEAGWNPETLLTEYEETTGRKYYLRLMAKGVPYELWGIVKTDIHFLGVDEGGVLFILGTDGNGRDLLSRIIYGARGSLSIGLMGALLCMVVGGILGGLSGCCRGAVDRVIARVAAVLCSFPAIPLWMALAATLPAGLPPVRTYFRLAVIFSLVGWTSVAGTVRARLAALRHEPRVVAAGVAGRGKMRVGWRHLAAGCAGHLVTCTTLAIPGAILGETILSFLGLGLRPPLTSWGVLLGAARPVYFATFCPWLMTPIVFVTITVLAFNLLGNGLRRVIDD